MNVPDKSARDEDRIFNEHRKQIDELQKDLHEKDQQIEEVIEDYQVQLEVRGSSWIMSLKCIGVEPLLQC